MPRFVKVASVNDLPEGAVRAFDAAGTPVAIYNVDGKVYATSNVCPHRGGPLGEGSLEGTTVTCPWHAFRFEVATGQCANQPALKVACHAVRIDGQDILVEI
jgi:nitrite reductase/ring-hydroxylating ferredoxin subunit